MNLYEILQVKKNANKDQIRLEYRKLAKKNHPDMPGGSKEKFDQLKLAHDILMDKEKRKVYDKTGKISNIEADNSDVEGITLVANILNGLLNMCLEKGVNPKNIDMAKQIKENLKTSSKNLEDMIEKTKEEIKLSRGIENRFSSDLINRIVKGRIDGLNQKLERSTEQRKVIEKAISLTKGLKFDYEEIKQNTSTSQVFVQWSFTS